MKRLSYATIYSLLTFSLLSFNGTTQLHHGHPDEHGQFHHGQPDEHDSK